jgi:hypothetical protein
MIHIRAYKDSEVWESRRKQLPPCSSKSTLSRGERIELCTQAKRKRIIYSIEYTVEAACQQNEIDEAMFEKFYSKEGWNPNGSI